MTNLQKAVISYKKFVELEKLVQEISNDLQCVTNNELDNFSDFGRSLQISVGLLLLNETNDPAQFKIELQKVIDEL